ncbi:MAG: alginate lyase family protein, partial [Planctomycetota bacterium]
MFEKTDSLPWKTTFTEPGDENWQQRWHLDGENATVKTIEGGFEFSAGPEEGNDAHHAVLWTRESFEGDVRISYDYTRLDDADHYVNILYILATGTGLGPYSEDILDWADRRKVPTMSKYFENMNLLHVSYAAHPTPAALRRGAEDREYIRVRRYPIPVNSSFDSTVVPPDYFETGLWQTGVKHHIDVIKRGPRLLMKVTPEGGETQYFGWNTSGWPPVREGRIGLRHMFTRSARYENFRVQTLAEDAPPMEETWRQLTSVEDVVGRYPDRIRGLLESLDLTREGMSDVRRALEDDDLESACRALLEYYRQADTVPWLREQQMDPGEGDISESALERAQQIVEEDIYRGHGGTARIPRNDAGHPAWAYTGPERDQGFRSRVNRHSHLSRLLRAYQATGDRRYIERLDADLRSWLICADGRLTPWGTGPLEPALRLPQWARTFYALQEEDRFKPATRLLMLATLPAHAEHTQNHLKRNHNFATMQMRGLGTLATAFPEFERSDSWWQFARDNMIREIEAQVYPDGVQTELSFGYHMVALKRFDAFREVAQKADRTLEDDYINQVERMWDYAAYALRPDGTTPLSGDSDRDNLSDRLRSTAEQFSRPDWLYIATKGREGERPEDPPSRFYPWAGQLISRSGWEEDAHWSFFDVGPWGTGHQHNDALHLSFFANGRGVLVDSGRFAYSGDLAEQFRDDYAAHTRGHNTVLLNGEGQLPAQQRAENPHVQNRITENFDFALKTFSDGYEAPEGANNGEQRGSHDRAVVYLRGLGWVVVDRMVAEGEHSIQPLWHYHPDVTVQKEGQTVITTDEDAGNIRLTPAGGMDWELDLIRGQEEPVPQGWYSSSYGEAGPATAAVYDGPMHDAAMFGWVITPGLGTPPSPEVEWMEAPEGMARIKVKWPHQPVRTITVVFDETELPLKLEDGRKFMGRLLIQTEDQTPEVARGWVESADGEILAEDLGSPDLLLEDLVSGLEPARIDSHIKTDGERHQYILQVPNMRFRRDLKFDLVPADDVGKGWNIDTSPASDTVEPGRISEVQLSASCATGDVRYPLPEIDLELKLSGAADGENRKPISATRTLRLDLLEDLPVLAPEGTDSAPELDGRLNDTA